MALQKRERRASHFLLLLFVHRFESSAVVVTGATLHLNKHYRSLIHRHDINFAHAVTVVATNDLHPAALEKPLRQQFTSRA